jgi:hypothetical protein
MGNKIFLLTFDEDLYGDKMQAVTDELHKLGVPATIFIDFRSKMAQEYAAKLKEQGFELQMHWVRFPCRTKKSLYFRREVSFEEQKKKVEKIIGQPVTGNRTHGLEWRGPNFIYPWEIMSQNGIKYSSTMYGFPNNFSPVDLKGKPLGIIEIPITHYESVPIKENELIVGLYHPHYDNWKAAVEWGITHKYKFMTISKKLKFS